MVKIWIGAFHKRKTSSLVGTCRKVPLVSELEWYVKELTLLFKKNEERFPR